MSLPDHESIAEPSSPDNDEVSLMAAEYGGAPEIDLHGYSVSDGIAAVDSFLHLEQHAGTEVIRIICGKGEGKLRTAIEQWLSQQQTLHGLITKYRGSNKPGEQGAVIVVALELLR